MSARRYVVLLTEKQLESVRPMVAINVESGEVGRSVGGTDADVRVAEAALRALDAARERGLLDVPEALARAATTLEAEAELYRDGDRSDRYQPHGYRLSRLAQRLRRMLTA